MPLTLRPCRIGGSSRLDDWQVMYEGHPVGRIFKTLHTVNSWQWHVQMDAVPGVNGRAVDLEAAKEAFKVAWDQAIVGFNADDFERAWEREREKPRPPVRAAGGDLSYEVLRNMTDLGDHI